MASKRRKSRARATRGLASPRKRASKPVAKKLKPAAKKTRRGRKTARAPALVEAVLAIFAHEVRTPLTGILAISDLLATSDLGERERRWVDTIKASAGHLAALTTLFVDAARSGVSGLPIRDEFFDLRTLARTAGDSLSGRAAAKGLTARIEIASELPAFVIGDPVQLRAALENLIDNAVKFTPAGNVAFAAKVRRVSKTKAVVSFAIADSGIGISAAEIERLFRPFSQANVSIAQRFGGAGLGLSSVRQLARAMGGDVTAAARKGGGTVFTLTASFALATGTAADASFASLELPRPLRILSVEDNPFGRVVLNAILQELGHATEFVGLGETAVERLGEGEFDLVLLDMVLPGIDGIETARRIRAKRDGVGRIAIIGLSGRDDDEARARAAGVDAFLLKPVSPRALAQALAAATRLKR